MSTTAQVGITIRNEATQVTRGAAYTGLTYYHGAYVVQAANGYWYDAGYTARDVSGIKAAGILQSEYFEEQTTAGLTPGTMVATASGSLSANTNCFNIYIGGEFEASFDTGTTVTKAYEGCTVYIYDNNTLTVDPGVGIYPIGVLTKYISATKCHVRLDQYGFKDNKQVIITSLDPTISSEAYLNVKNPYGFDVGVSDFFVRITTPTTTGGTGAVGICPSSTFGIATWIISSSGIDSTTAGLYSPRNTMTTDNTSTSLEQSALDRIWKSTEYIAFRASTTTSAAGAGCATSLVAYAYIESRKI